MKRANTVKQLEKMEEDERYTEGFQKTHHNLLNMLEKVNKIGSKIKWKMMCNGK